MYFKPGAPIPAPLAKGGFRFLLAIARALKKAKARQAGA